MKSGRGGPRPNSGRKPRADKPATKLISMRFTEEEYQALKEKADQAGCTIPQYIRSKI